MNWNFQNSYTELPSIYYSNVKPENLENAQLLLFNNDLAKELDLNLNGNQNDICNSQIFLKKIKYFSFFSIISGNNLLIV